MSFVGITFDGQNVAPSDDGALYAAHYGDGIIDGCAMTISGDDLVIQSGRIIAGGRACKVDGATNVDLSGRLLSTGYIQVILNYDLTQSEGNQWYENFVESATTTFPALTQGNINNTDTLYQFELAIIQVSGGNLTSIYSQATPSLLISPNATYYLDSNGDIKGKAEAYTSPYDVKFMRTDNDGANISGVRATDTDVVLFSDGANVVLRPNGVYNNAQEAYLDPSGDFHLNGQLLNGLSYHSGSQQATAVSAGATTEVIRITGLTAGIYLATVYLSINVTTTTTGLIQVLWYRNGSNIALDHIFTNTNARKYRTTAYLFDSGTTSISVYLGAPSGVALSSIQASLRAVRLG